MTGIAWLGAISLAWFIGSTVFWLCFGSWRSRQDEPDARDVVRIPLDGDDQEILDSRNAAALSSTQAPLPDGAEVATAAAAPADRAILPVPIQVAATVAQVAIPQGHDGPHPDAIEETMPTALAATAHSPEHAIPLVVALLFDDRPDVRARQETCVRQFLGEPVLADANALAPQVAQLDPMMRLPVAELAFPALRKRPRPELASLIACADAMTQADGEASLFEYCVGCMLHRQLAKSLDPSASWRAGRKKPLDVLDEIALLLSLVAQNGIAQNGEGSAAAAQDAYTTGMHSILPDANIPYAPPAVGVSALDKAWTELDGLDSIGKTLLIEGMVAVIGQAAKPTVAQSELLRTACAVLDCPLPPMLDHAQP